jgi:hypothetical protein
MGVIYPLPFTMAPVEQDLAAPAKERAQKFFSQIYDGLSDGIGGYRKEPMQNFGHFVDQVIFNIQGGWRDQNVGEGQLMALAHQFHLRRNMEVMDDLMRAAQMALQTVAEFACDVQSYPADQRRVKQCLREAEAIRQKRQTLAHANQRVGPDGRPYIIPVIKTHELAVEYRLLPSAALPAPSPVKGEVIADAEFTDGAPSPPSEKRKTAGPRQGDLFSAPRL